MSSADEELCRRHEALITGLNRYYDLLIKMCHLTETQVERGPHPESLFNVQGYLDQGMTPEAVALLKYLPYCTEETDWGPEIYNMGWTYRYQDYKEEALYVERLENVIPGSWIRIVSSYGYGCHCFYDTANRTMLRWWTPAVFDFDKMDRKPVTEELGNWIRILETLEWIACPPGSSRSFAISPTESLRYFNSQDPLHDPRSPLKTKKRIQDNMNSYYSIKRLYLEAGWKDDFKEAELVEKCEEWSEGYLALFTKIGKANQRYDKEGEIAAKEALSEYLKGTAGENALRVV